MLLQSGAKLPDRRSLLFSSIGLPLLRSVKPEERYLFTTDQHRIRLSLEYHDGYVADGLRWRELSSLRSFCLSAQGDKDRNCLADFTGSIAIARYQITPLAGSLLSLSLREEVRDVDRSDDVPLRAPFERLIETERGLASDLQVFGYQQSAGKDSRPGSAWCLFRQNLYLTNGPVPFLVIHWKHTLAAIRILDLIPGRGTLQSAQTRVDHGR